MRSASRNIRLLSGSSFDDARLGAFGVERGMPALGVGFRPSQVVLTPKNMMHLLTLASRPYRPKH